MDVQFSYRRYHDQKKVIQIKYDHDLIRESQLPLDWLKKTMEGFSKQADFYFQGVNTNKIHNIVNLSIDKYISKIVENKNSILDIGVGDGGRIDRIASLMRRNQGSLKLFGTDINSNMLKKTFLNNKSRKCSINLVKADMMNELPFKANTLDVVTLLSGNLGYIMDANPQNGFKKRVHIFNSAYRVLRNRGIFILDLIHEDDNHDVENGLVQRYFRTPVIDGSPISKLANIFYLKQFNVNEIRKLITKSHFSLQHASLHLFLKKIGDGYKDGNLIGTIVKSYNKFTNYSMCDLHLCFNENKKSKAEFRMVLIVNKY